MATAKKGTSVKEESKRSSTKKKKPTTSKRRVQKTPSSLHVITGLPRAGSTLLCNILNQNPKFSASSTSVLPGMLNSISTFWSNSLETKALLNQQRKETELKMRTILRSITEEWYSEIKEKKIVFDKSRIWGMHVHILKTLYPQATLIVCVRDLKAVFASIQKQHLKEPYLDEATNPLQKGELARLAQFFSANGLVGLPLKGVEELVNKQEPNAIYVQYEALAQDPEKVMQAIYKKINVKYFEHDFEDVKNTATDPDGFYLNKYPHKGEGKVEPQETDNWKKYITQIAAERLDMEFKGYNEIFGYASKTQENQVNVLKEE